MASARIDQSFLQRAKRDPGLYWDTAIKGFGVRVGANQRPVSYLFQKSGGRRVTLGAVERIELNEARAKAKRLDASHLEAGPSRNRPITVSEGLDTHIQSMEARQCSQASIKLMRDEVRKYAVGFLDRRLDRIDHGAIAQLHVALTKNSGPYLANRVVRHLRTVYGTANVPWPMSPRWRKNPENKEGKAPIRDLVLFGAIVRGLDNPNLADWWRLTLITGLRRTDALTIRWSEIDARRPNWLLRPCPKGGPRRAFELPITTHMRTIFQRQAVESEWVFTGNVRQEHLKEPKKPGLPTPHRLRATWATRAAELGCPVPVMAALLNHSVKSQNITLRYATPSDASLAEWAQRVADSLWGDIR